MLRRARDDRWIVAASSQQQPCQRIEASVNEGTVEQNAQECTVETDAKIKRPRCNFLQLPTHSPPAMSLSPTVTRFSPTVIQDRNSRYT